MKNRPFDNPYGESTMVRNAVFDRIMPTLSSDGWKVLCVALRHTWGWCGDESPGVTVSQFIEKTGIEERGAIERAIKECLDASYLVHCQADQDAQLAEPLDVYALNVEFETRGPIAEAEPLADSTPFEPENERAFQALLDFGREMGVEPEPAPVREAVTRNDAGAVLVWIEIGREMTNLEKRARFQTVVKRLLDQVPPLPLAMLDLDSQSHPIPPAEEPESDVVVARELWQATLEELRTQMRKSKFMWLKPTQGIKLAEGTLTVTAPNKRTKEWLETGQFATNIRETLEAVAGEPIALAFVVEE